MSGVINSHPSEAVLTTSIVTLLGSERYLERVCQKLYANAIYCVGDLISLTESDFEDVVGRTSMQNMMRIKARLQEAGLSFSI